MTRNALALAALFLLIAAWSLVIPIGEAPDEDAHWEFARFVHVHHRLPVVEDHLAQWIQMPLYYLLAAPFAVSADFPARTTINPPDAPAYSLDPPKFFYHDDADFRRYWPIRWTRFFTALAALIAVAFCYLAALEATGSRPTAYLAAGLMALLPEFTFRSASVNNDMLAAALSSASIYYCVRLFKRGPNWRDACAGSLAMGLAFVTKMHTIFLPVVWLTALFLTSRPRARLKWIAALAIWIALASGPLVRNYVLYRDPFLIRTEAGQKAPDRIPHTLLSPYFRDMFPTVMARSFIAGFGQMNLWAPEWVYRLYRYLLLASILGALLAAARRKLDWKLAILLLAVIAGNLAIVIKANMSFQQPQGRYMFPALSAICLLCAIGLRSLPGFRAAAVCALLAVLAAVNVDLLCNLIFPTYWEYPAMAQNEADIPLGPLSAQSSVEQTFLSPCVSLDRIDIQIGNYVAIQRGQVILTLFDPARNAEVGRQSVWAPRIEDNTFVKFRIAPVDHALGEELRIRLQGTVPPGRGVAIWSSSAHPLADLPLFWNGKSQPGAITFRVYCSGQWGFARVKRLLSAR